jgi:hypothetical protein
MRWREMAGGGGRWREVASVPTSHAMTPLSIMVFCGWRRRESFCSAPGVGFRARVRVRAGVRGRGRGRGRGRARRLGLGARGRGESLCSAPRAFCLERLSTSSDIRRSHSRGTSSG